MPQLLELSAEIILCVASFLEQVDLLNISLACKHLERVTKPELYRVYSNPHLHKRLIAKFVTHLARHSELAKYVKEIDLKGWDTLSELLPEYYEANYELSGIRSTREEKTETFDRFRKPEPTEDEYSLLTAAAAATGIIKDAYPYEGESTIISKVRPMLSTDVPSDSIWYATILGQASTWASVPYDRRFCELLRAGMGDAYAVLLLALLPNLSHIFLRGAGADPTALGLPRPSHAYKALRILKVGSMDFQDAWGLDYLNGILVHAPLEELYLHNASSWCEQDLDHAHNNRRLATLQLRAESLRLTKIEMVKCTLRKSDMQTLLNTTTSLRSLLFWVGNDQHGPESLLSQELVEMLEPFESTLEELYLEFDNVWDGLAEGQIKTLSHFTALKILGSTVEIWECLLDGEINVKDMEAEQLFCHRLPRNLERLILHPLQYSDDEMAPDVPDQYQIESIDSECSELLPYLRDVYIGSAYVDDAHTLNDALNRRTRHRPDLRITVDTNGTRTIPANSFSDEFFAPVRRTDLRWNGDKYSVSIT